jgi:hypothetical protein
MTAPVSFDGFHPFVLMMAPDVLSRRVRGITIGKGIPMASLTPHCVVKHFSTLRFSRGNDLIDIAQF